MWRCTWGQTHTSPPLNSSWGKQHSLPEAYCGERIHSKCACRHWMFFYQSHLDTFSSLPRMWGWSRGGYAFHAGSLFCNKEKNNQVWALLMLHISKCTCPTRFISTVLALSNLQIETLSSGGSNIIRLYLNVWICNAHSHSLFSLLVFLVFPACLSWCFLPPHLLQIKPAWLKWMGFVAAGSDFWSLVRQHREQCTGIAFMQPEKLLLIKFAMSWLKKLSWSRSDQLSPDSLVTGCLLPPLTLCSAKPNCLEMPNEGQARMLCALINKKLTSGHWLFPALPAALVCREAAIISCLILLDRHK